MFRHGPFPPSSNNPALRPDVFRHSPSPPSFRNPDVHPDVFRRGPSPPSSHNPDLHPDVFRRGSSQVPQKDMQDTEAGKKILECYRLQHTVGSDSVLCHFL